MSVDYSLATATSTKSRPKDYRDRLEVHKAIVVNDLRYGDKLRFFIFGKPYTFELKEGPRIPKLEYTSSLVPVGDSPSLKQMLDAMGIHVSPAKHIMAVGYEEALARHNGPEAKLIYAPFVCEDTDDGNAYIGVKDVAGMITHTTYPWRSFAQHMYGEMDFGTFCRPIQQAPPNLRKTIKVLRNLANPKVDPEIAREVLIEALQEATGENFASLLE